jgi:hypothetical protein
LSSGTISKEFQENTAYRYGYSPSKVNGDGKVLMPIPTAVDVVPQAGTFVYRHFIHKYTSTARQGRQRFHTHYSERTIQLPQVALVVHH